MKIKWQGQVDYIFFILSVGVLIFGLLVERLENINPSFIIADILLIISNIVFSIRKEDKSWIFLLLQVTVFTFLLGQSLFCYIENDFSKFELSQYELNLSNILIWISLFGSRLSYMLFSSTTISIGNRNSKRFLIDNPEVYYDSIYVKRVKNISKIIFYITYPFLIFSLFDRIQFVSNYSYIESYTVYSSSLSLWANRVSTVTIPVLYVFLGTMPNKKECKIPLVLYAIYTVFTLGTQVRNKFVINLIMILIYLLIRNRRDKSDEWISKKTLITGFVMVPLVLVLLSIMEYTRVGSNFEFSFIGLIKEFFQNQGGSIRVIGFSERNRETLLSYNHHYLLGTFIWLLKYNFATKWIFGLTEPAVRTAAMAMESNQLSHALTYLYNPLAYANGYGIGSCYIAEAYIQYGFIGVFIVGAIVGSLSIFVDKHIYSAWTPIRFAFLLMIFSQIIYLPRGSFGAILSQTFTYTNVIIFLFIFLYAKGKNR